jgi:23S rRNA (cytidine1920-2'-O)/16S rRNA (cytidine1409-2'-O)-methyltransferase
LRRRLDAELVRRGLVPSRARAVEVIDAGLVTVGGAPATVASRQVAPAEAVVVAAAPARFVSRGGEKLDAALETWAVDVHGRRVLDAGASTGGFTDCLRQRGADPVVAVDVGHGQLAWSLRNDPGVVVMERTNLRHLEELPGGPAEIAVADLSFISLRTVAPALVRLSVPAATYVLLVKPQFEAGRRRVGRGGIVRDPMVHRAVLDEVVEGLGEEGIVVTDVMRSPLTGADGNVEFLARGARQGRAVAPAALDALVPVEPRVGEP